PARVHHGHVDLVPGFDQRAADLFNAHRRLSRPRDGSAGKLTSGAAARAAPLDARGSSRDSARAAGSGARPNTAPVHGPGRVARSRATPRASAPRFMARAPVRSMSAAQAAARPAPLEAARAPHGRPFTGRAESRVHARLLG